MTLKNGLTVFKSIWQMTQFLEHLICFCRRRHTDDDHIWVCLGECKPEEVYGVARELQRRISAFAKQMQARRHLLDLSVLFHTHYKEVRVLTKLLDP